MLRVWLPLTKDLRNQGLENITVTTSNTNAFQNEGKLGNKSLDVSGHYAFKVPSLVKKRVFSCSFWYKPITNSSLSDNWRRIIVFDTYTSDGSTTGAIFRFESSYGYQSSSTSYCISIHNNVGEPIASIGTSLGYSDGWDKWQHIAITADGTTLKCYRDGVQIASGAMSNGGMLQGTVHIGYSGNRPVGRLNDFRLYDHCLSPMEVKELSKGLVLHYPLNRGGWGQENLITGYDTSFLSYSDGTVTLFSNQMNGGVQEIVSNIGGATKCLHLHSNGGNNRQYGTLSATSGKSYIISCDYYSTSSQAIPFRGELNGGNYSWTGSNAAAYTTPNKWVRLSFSYLNLTSDATIYYFMQCSQNTDCYIKNLKIEEGSIATPWCPNSSDALATAMGLNGVTEYDCSGFCNNGTRTGTFSWTSDTPKYSVSSIYTGSNYIYLDSPPTETQTIAVWAKWDTIPSGQSVILVDNGSGIGLGLMSTGILCSTSKVGSSYTFSKANLIANTWYHFVIVKTGTTTRKLYINGVEQTATSNTSNWTYSVDQLQLGKRSTTSDGFAGRLCDFRAYATALSADDVQSLYQNSAYIDSSGNVYGAVHSEV